MEIQNVFAAEHLNRTKDTWIFFGYKKIQRFSHKIYKSIQSRVNIKQNSTIRTSIVLRCRTFFCILLFRILALSFLAFALALILNGFIVKPARKFNFHDKQYLQSHRTHYQY